MGNRPLLGRARPGLLVPLDSPELSVCLLLSGSAPGSEHRKKKKLENVREKNEKRRRMKRENKKREKESKGCEE